ncbi:MAG: tRNA 2-thiouridine(34) synthase MnmA [Candidatus Taylorbacteria bacterium]
MFNSFRDESILNEERAKSIEGRLDYIAGAIKKLEVAKKRITEAFKAEAMTLPEFRKEKTDIELSEEKLISERDALMIKLNVQHDVSAKIDLFKETCHKFLSKINDPKIVTERLKKDIIKLVINEVVIEGESVKIFATIPLPNKIHEREMDKTDIPGTFNAGATLGPVNETNMTRIWNKHKQTNTPLKRKVFVGLSGGVDSAVSAALLQKAGFDVIGVFIKVWQPDWIECNWAEERRDAMRVAAHLGIPFLTLDCEKEYKQGVIDYMIAEYKIGRTPNPDVMCNKTVKFGAFYDWALEKGADFVATGHYARVGGGIFGSCALGYMSRPAGRAFVLGASAPPKAPIAQLPNIPPKLLAGLDRNKDQSYFLWTIKKEQLSHIMFPIGGMTKPEVRKMAERFGLPNAEKKDSQGLCFIGHIDLKDFLSHYIDSVAGNVLNENGEVIGSHPGALFFTIGERHGFKIDRKTPDDQPYFVVDKDIDQNTITVSTRDSSQLLSSATRTVRLGKVNWVAGEAPSIGGVVSVASGSTDPVYNLQARSRYRQELQNMKIVSSGITETVCEFEQPQDTLTPGQSLVIYDGEECLGGGVIE